MARTVTAVLPVSRTSDRFIRVVVAMLAVGMIIGALAS
jgi:hypothetical protein